MYKITKKGSNDTYSVVELVVDTTAGIAELPVKYAAGSIAYCFEDKKFYMLNFDGAWVEA